MDTNSEEGNGSMPELEGVPVIEGGGEFSPPANVPISDLSVPLLAEQPSSQNLSFSIPTPSRVGFNQFHPIERVAPIFGPNAPFWETSLGQAISEFRSTSVVNVIDMELTPNSRKPLPYLLPSDILGRSLNIPSSSIPANTPPASMMTRLTTPAGVP